MVSLDVNAPMLHHLLVLCFLFFESAPKAAEKLTGNRMFAFSADVDADVRLPADAVFLDDGGRWAFLHADGRELIAGDITADLALFCHGRLDITPRHVPSVGLSSFELSNDVGRWNSCA